MTTTPQGRELDISAALRAIAERLKSPGCFTRAERNACAEALSTLAVGFERWEERLKTALQQSEQAEKRAAKTKEQMEILAEQVRIQGERLHALETQRMNLNSPTVSGWCPWCDVPH
jgi:chromosome segregation ATPase